MEYAHDSVVVGIGQDLLVKTDGLLLVTAPEINLDSLAANLLQPSHLLLADYGVVHLAYGALGNIVPIAA